jgi:membrane-associated HD superfamily phosphohydrolase
MTAKATEKIIDALSQLFEGYTDLKNSIRRELGHSVSSESVTSKKEADDDIEDEDLSDEEIEAEVEVDEALVNELKAAIETVLESEDFSPEDFALLISQLTDALEEIDPGVFGGETEEKSKEEDEDDVDYDDDDLDDLDEDDEEFKEEDDEK